MAKPWSQEVERWLSVRTISVSPPSRESLAAAKQAAGARVTVCLPALDEAATISAICATLARELLSTGLIDELLVIDSGSTDGTPERATGAGAKVHAVGAILPELDPGPRPSGKGEALWRSLAVATGDIVVWIDADIRDFQASFVTSLIAPLLADPALVMTKGFYERPVEGEAGGGRVTELGARPLLRLLYPRLSGMIQPLSGEYAIRRSVAYELPFLTGYGVDAGLLIDLVHLRGLEAIAQVDLGTRIHRNRSLLELGRTSFEVMHGILLRLDDIGAVTLPDPLPTSLLQFLGDGAPRTFPSAATLRPPMADFSRPQ